jgi:hypothetical protein
MRSVSGYNRYVCSIAPNETQNIMSVAGFK